MLFAKGKVLATHNQRPKGNGVPQHVQKEYHSCITLYPSYFETRDLMLTVVVLSRSISTYHVVLESLT